MTNQAPTHGWIIGAFVNSIDDDEFIPRFRRRELHLACRPIVGWGDRLTAYFWPTPKIGYGLSILELQSIVDAGRTFAATFASRDWDDEGALAWARRVFDWGRVDQPYATGDQVRRVVKAAVSGVDCGAPMNSGWTKVAAFATAHLEAANGAQAIWDSRVSNSIVSRLDVLLTEAGLSHIPSSLGGLGEVPGRGGSRVLKRRRLPWPNAYQKWSSQFAATQFIRDVRDELNRRCVKIGQPNGGRDIWTVRAVEMVLFMDGY